MTRLKVRIGRDGQGKRGGYRTFIYGFAKNETDNINSQELEYYKKYAESLLNLDTNLVNLGCESGIFYRINENEN
jgi:hypothetical protein